MAKASNIAQVNVRPWKSPEGQERTFFEAVEVMPNAGATFSLDGFQGPAGVYQLEGEVYPQTFPGKNGGPGRTVFTFRVISAQPLNLAAVVQQALNGTRQPAPAPAK